MKLTIWEKLDKYLWGFLFGSRISSNYYTHIEEIREYKKYKKIKEKRVQLGWLSPIPPFKINIDVWIFIFAFEAFIQQIKMEIGEERSTSTKYEWILDTLDERFSVYK